MCRKHWKVEEAVMNNVFKGYTAEQLIGIVSDLQESKMDGKRPESLVPYAKQISENLNSASGTQLVSMRECLEIAKSDFLDVLFERILHNNVKI